MNNELLSTGNWQPTKEYVRNYQQKMQNKANLPEAKMSTSALLTKDYDNNYNPTLGESKPNSKPIQTQTNPISRRQKMSATFFAKGNYKNPAQWGLEKNKPNSNPISSEAKMTATVCPTGNCLNKPLRAINPISKQLHLQGAEQKHRSQVVSSTVLQERQKVSHFCSYIVDLSWLCWYPIAAKVRNLNRGTIVAN